MPAATIFLERHIRALQCPSMPSKATVVARFAEHVAKQRASRESEGSSYTPNSAAKAEREELMDELVAALSLSSKELQDKLGINRTTWDRWRRMSSAPNRSHLDHLRKLAQDGEHGGASPPFTSSLGPPFEFLSQAPGTFGQLRLLFAHRGYHWTTAIFHFRTPFEDPHMVIDMASLGLNGCKIIYLLQKSFFTAKDEKDSWLVTYVKNMARALGRQVAAQALSRFCFIEITEDEDKRLDDFGVLNLWPGAHEAGVGYLWLGNQDKLNSADYLFEKNQYIARKSVEQDFDLLRKDIYDKAIKTALETVIESNESEVDDGDKIIIRKLNTTSQAVENITIYA